MKETSVDANPFRDALAYFVEAPHLAEYGNNFDSMKDAYLSTRPFAGAGIVDVSDSLKRVIFEQGFFNLLTAAKLKYIFLGASDCFKSSNVIGLAYFARAALEHVSTYAYVVKTSESTVDKLSGQNSPQKALEALRALSDSFRVSYYGSGDRNEQSNIAKRPIHIHDAINALDDYFGYVTTQSDPENSRRHSFLFHEALTAEEARAKFGILFDPFPKIHLVRADYDFLCDFVHPNYGSNFLVTSGTIAEGSIDTPNEHIRNISFLFVKKSLRYWLYYRELQVRDFSAHLKFGAWLQRSHKNGAKASRIFAKKSSKFDGDGQSIQTAYTFPSARDKIEEFEMFRDLLRHLKVEKHARSIVEASENSIVDRVEADNGLVFFVKYRKLELP
jgi:hypothetical protein